jgi:hypothetical protein
MTTVPARSHLPTVEAHALERLEYIRSAMDRAGGFTAVPGLGGALVGATALGAAALAWPSRGSGRWLTIWLLEAGVAIVIGLITTVRKARRSGVPLAGPAARRFALAFSPPIVAGAVLTAWFTRVGPMHALPGCWLLLYGTAVTTGGALSVRLVPVMGVCFMAAGVLALLVPGWGDILLAAGFGGLQVLFGVLIARKHGG